MSTEFEAVIGLEVHAQLATNSKLFCGCKARLPIGVSVSDEGVNANSCPICTGHPGTLPVINEKAVQFAIKAGLATHCKINLRSVFSRKNYFYPDLPKGYQISQYDLPLCSAGWLNLNLKDGETKKINIERIHMEEDAGKNVHMSGFSVVNFNRAGVPLIEIVSAPDMRSAEEAGAYLRALHSIVTYIDVCDGNMQEGNFRCDANVSVRPKGSEKFGTRAEVKNVNSFRFVEKAIEYEIARQIELVRSGGTVVQETRNYDSTKNVTTSLRSKEEAHDYRYFPEPDLIPLTVEESLVHRLKEELPELPDAKRERYQSDYGLSTYDAGVLTASKTLALFFESTMIELVEKRGQKTSVAKPVANLLAGEVSRLMNEEDKEVNRSLLKPVHLADLVLLLNENLISSSNAKKVISIAWSSGEPVEAIVEKNGFKQVSDLGAIEPIVKEIIEKHPQQVEQFKAGKDKLIGFFVGQVMKATQGKVNPGMVQEVFRKNLK